MQYTHFVTACYKKERPMDRQSVLLRLSVLARASVLLLPPLQPTLPAIFTHNLFQIMMRSSLLRMQMAAHCHVQRLRQVSVLGLMRWRKERATIECCYT